MPDTPPPPRTTGGNWRWEPPSAAELQAVMPGYSIEKILGRGGMGAVYRGVQTNLDRPVAIKILPPGVEKEDPSFAERFKSEARLMAKLNHPAVVAVYDFGTTSAGQLYFAMEYVDGSDVSQMIAAQGRLPAEHALAITAHVCDALGAAHELGIVHRDIKPANVLLNMKGQVKVADFGLAKVEEPGQHGLTKTGYAMGTPDFVAPEALMLGAAIDGRADIYAVGVMLYQMLTGNIPRGAFKPASVLVPGLDPRYDSIIQKAMQHDREERYQNSAELRRALDVILTVPLVQQNAPASAAIPVAQMAQAPGQRSVAQKPVAKGPQQRSDAGAAVKKPSATKSAPAPVSPPAKSQGPLFAGLGIAAVLGIGAFVMFGGKKPEGSTADEPATAKTSEVSASTASTSQAPSVPSSSSSTVAKPSDLKPPSGQWMKLFTKGEALPQSGVWKGDWIEGARVFYLKQFDQQSTRNVAVRTTLKESSIESSSDLYVSWFSLRRNGEAAYVMRLRRDGTLEFVYALQLLTNGSKSGNDRIFHSVKLGTAFERAKPMTLEFAAVGTHLLGRVNGKVIAWINETALQDGKPRIEVAVPIRDIEAINLDGLSETEALKVLGVDENGNDLRKPAVMASAPPKSPTLSQLPPPPRTPPSSTPLA